MPEQLNQLPDTATKEEKYLLLLKQLASLTAAETDLIANLANIAAAITQTFGFFWLGFYLVKGNQLVLGPFQGPVACTRIDFGKGVCGAAWKEKRIINVDDVFTFAGHIACSNESKSEIVLPVFKAGEVFMVLDIDSDELAAFDETDEQYLQEAVILIETLL